MSFLVVRFQRWHMARVMGGPTTEVGAMNLSDLETLRALERSANTWTALVEDTPIACGGTVEYWPGRHQAWALLATEAKDSILGVTRAARAALRSVKGRVECTVRDDFPAGKGWAELLGFKVENKPGVLKGYGPQGEDHVAYVLFN